MFRRAENCLFLVDALEYPYCRAFHFFRLVLISCETEEIRNSFSTSLLDALVSSLAAEDVKR